MLTVLVDKGGDPVEHFLAVFARAQRIVAVFVGPAGGTTGDI